MVPLAFITMLPVAGGVLTVPRCQRDVGRRRERCPGNTHRVVASTDVAVVATRDTTNTAQVVVHASMMATEPLPPLLPVTVSLLALVVP